MSKVSFLKSPHETDDTINVSPSVPPKKIHNGNTKMISSTNVSFSDVVKYASLGEMGSARLFSRLNEDKVIYDASDNEWYIWKDNLWKLDRTGDIVNVMFRCLSANYANALKTAYNTFEKDDSRIKTLGKVLNALNYKSSLQNVLTLAKSQREISITNGDWNNDPYLLGVKNGIVNLRDGSLRPNMPKDYIRLICNTEYTDDMETCPKFDKFLTEVFAGDMDRIYFLQRLLGYSLTGQQIEHVLPIFCGEHGSNGKGVLLNTLQNVLGDFVSPIPQEVLLSGNKSPGAATPFLAMLQHKRLCYVSETNDGDSLNSGVVKNLTGNDMIVARNLYGKPFTFMPSHTVILITNHLPHSDSNDEALWRRVVLFEFTQRFLDNPTEDYEHEINHHLIEELEGETSGILAWLVRGCMWWQRAGLDIPKSVKIATEKYRQKEDVLGQFLEDVCVIDDEQEVTAKELYLAYGYWCDINGMRKKLTGTTFGKRMTRRFEKTRRRAGFVYSGVSVGAETLTEIRLKR